MRMGDWRAGMVLRRQQRGQSRGLNANTAASMSSFDVIADRVNKQRRTGAEHGRQRRDGAGWELRETSVSCLVPRTLATAAGGTASQATTAYQRPPSCDAATPSELAAPIAPQRAL
jgi:hypothetical protein